MQYKYERELPTGLGDRLGCIICVSALGRALDKKRFAQLGVAGIEQDSLGSDKLEITKMAEITKIHLFWCEKSNINSAAHRFYPFCEISKYLKFPSNLIFHTKEDLDKLEYPAISWQGGELPATFAYDCIPTLAHKTFNQTIFKHKIDSETYKSAYDEVAAEVTIENLLIIEKLPYPYGVLHVRGGDKANWSSSFIASTMNVMQQLQEKGFNEWILVTDDETSYQLFKDICKTTSKDLQVLCAKPKNADEKGSEKGSEKVLEKGSEKGLENVENGSKNDSKNDSILNMMRDMKILLDASLIVQHVSDGWSAFSNIPASLRNTPIINTYPHFNHNLLMSFYHLGGQPQNYYRCDELDKFIEFLNSRSSRND